MAGCQTRGQSGNQASNSEDEPLPCNTTPTPSHAKEKQTKKKSKIRTWSSLSFSDEEELSSDEELLVVYDADGSDCCFF